MSNVYLLLLVLICLLLIAYVLIVTKYVLCFFMRQTYFATFVNTKTGNIVSSTLIYGRFLTVDEAMTAMIQGARKRGDDITVADFRKIN